MKSKKDRRGQDKKKSARWYLIPFKAKKRTRVPDFGHINRIMNAEKTAMLFFDD